MQKRRFGLSMAALLIATACGTSTTSSGPSASAPASVTPTTAASPTPVVTPPPPPIDITATNYKPDAVANTGGKLVMGLSGEPTTAWYTIFDTFANDVDAFSISLWGLWNNTADLKYYGQLAASVPTVDSGDVKLTGDKMDVTVHLREGGQWSDGQPITCDDVIFMWHWMLDPAQVGNTWGHQGYEDIESIDGAGTTTCVMHFKKVYEQFLGLFQPLLPKHYVEPVPVADAFTKLYTQPDIAKGVYSGPYQPTNWSAGAEIDYKANAPFWSTIKKTTAPFDELALVLYSNPDAEIAAFSKGDIDLGLEFNHTHIASIKAANIPDTQMDAITGVTYENHSWNMKNLTTKFGDAGAKAMMEALHYAVDKDAINARILGGTVTPSCSFTSSAAWFYSDVPCYSHDADKAAKVLADAGFTKGADGLLAMNGNKAEFTACARIDRQYRIDTLTLLASQLQPLGIKINVETPTADDLFGGWAAKAADTPCNLAHGTYDVSEFAYLGTPDPASIYPLYHSKYDPDGGDHSGQNYIRVHNPELDTLLDSVASTLDLPAIKDDMAKVQELYIDPANGFPEIALYNWTTVLLKSPKLHNVTNNSSAATQTWNLEDVWREP